MSRGGFINVFLLFVAVGAYYLFILKGKNNGQTALASRAQQLVNSGCLEVYLLYGSKGVGLSNQPVSQGSVWSFLNTGFLAYLQGQDLVIEFPWWKNMRPFQVLDPQKYQITRSVFTYVRKRHPALQIGDQTYVVVGKNVYDQTQVKAALNMKNSEYIDELTTSLSGSLQAAGFNVLQK